jgi:hypothetical protein
MLGAPAGLHLTCATHIPGTPVGYDLEPCRKRNRLRARVKADFPAQADADRVFVSRIAKCDGYCAARGAFIRA